MDERWPFPIQMAMQRHTGCRFPLVPALKPGPLEGNADITGEQSEAAIGTVPDNISPERKPGSND